MKYLTSMIVLTIYAVTLMSSVSHCGAHTIRTLHKYNGGLGNYIIKNCLPIMRIKCYQVIHKCKVGGFVRGKRSINSGYRYPIYARRGRYQTRRRYRRQIHANCHTCRPCMS